MNALHESNGLQNESSIFRKDIYVSYAPLEYTFNYVKWISENLFNKNIKFNPLNQRKYQHI